MLLTERDEVVLNWPFKDCVLEGGMIKENKKREEVFFNNILGRNEIDRLEESKVFVNWKRYTSKGEESFTEFNKNEAKAIKDNLVIKGNNLLALNCLKQVFAGRIKVIYIDPPYNTGEDGFGYNDNFNHSTWLTFMKNRLELAIDLLAEDGLIFIQINDIEQDYLKVLCDEIFTRENFQTTICVQMSHLSGVKMAHKEKKIPKIKEYVLFYSKAPVKRINPQYIATTWNDALERYTSFVNRNGFSDDDCGNW